ncbi:MULTISPECIES: hypothetical protein [Roseomonadaceae]|uniref:Uncharacterized protein n=1 Tax=Falsiroseomonas oleicola TaxID=2801474 RepID=A0ABS6HCT8_9PROT|nr:hypothetical protein [Roseomonas oleicola]MBU8545622.1 hypothetical protein [Roseomonas oleicola]
MPIKAAQTAEAVQVARLKAALEEELERMLRWRGPVTEVRRLVAELDQIDLLLGRATARAGSHGHDQMAG